jgi:hypothetical protein
MLLSLSSIKSDILKVNNIIIKLKNNIYFFITKSDIKFSNTLKFIVVVLNKSGLAKP